MKVLYTHLAVAEINLKNIPCLIIQAENEDEFTTLEDIFKGLNRILAKK